MGDKYHRLNIFVDKISPKPLRKTFLKKMMADAVHRNDTLDNYLCARKKELYPKGSKKIIRNNQWDLLFPRKGQADISSWDITLVAFLIDILFSKQLNYIEKHAIDEIKCVRNDLKHMPDTSMSNEEFDRLWTKLEKATITLARQISQVPPYEIEIQKLIDNAKINNMPDLGGAFQNMLKSSIMEQNANTEEMKDNLRSLISTTEDNLSCSRESQAILKDSSVQKVGPGGRPVKRLKIFDNVFNHLNQCFKTTLNEGLPVGFDIPSEVEDIKTKLQQNHHCVVTGHQGSPFLETALAAIKDLHNHEWCVEMNKVSDWRHIDLQDVDLILFKQPFSALRFDNKKAEEMDKILKTMYQATKSSDGKSPVDIVIVSDEDALKKFSSAFKLEILDEVVKVNSPTSENAPVDLTCNSNKISENEISSPLQNMIDFSVLHAESKKDISTVSKTVVDDAKAKLKKHKVIMITGPRKSGKTTLALKLTSIYQKGEYIIINNPDDMKHVSLNKICLVVIEDFAGKYQFDVDSTNSWMRKFEEIYSAVKAGKLNVILTSDDKMLEKCKVEFENHPIFDITVDMNVSDVTIKQEKDENVSPNTSLSSDVDTKSKQNRNKIKKFGNITRPPGKLEMNTLVFMHVNTTSLPKTSDCRITELCLLAVNRNNLKHSIHQLSPSLPRVRDKLSMCFDPDKHIVSEAASISRLTEDLLSDQHQFTWRSVLAIKLFLMNLKQPYCFVAHNGNNFDFKVLKAELKRLSLENLPLSNATVVNNADNNADSDDEMETIIEDTGMPVTDKEFDSIFCVDSLIYIKKNTPVYSSTSLRPLFQEIFWRQSSYTHTAEGFCNALVSVVKCFPNFLSWVDENAELIADIEPAY